MDKIIQKALEVESGGGMVRNPADEKRTKVRLAEVGVL